MDIEQAKTYVNGEIARIETENPVGELRPWLRDACPAALEHWGLVQQRIALSRGNPKAKGCCDELNLTLPERTPAQKRAAEVNGRRLVASRIAA
jgi:hypothetical protein